MIKHRWLKCAMVCLLAVLMLGAGADDAQSRYGRIGHEMMCVCGCGQVLLECNHVGCPDSARMIGELGDQVATLNGGADSLILNWFVAKYGAVVLAAPIRGGFDNFAWIAPMVAFILAIFGTAYVVRMWSGRREATATPGTTPAINDDLRERIRRETEY